jgi:dihydroorotate dehydrogenase electron transfer subunit
MPPDATHDERTVFADRACVCRAKVIENVQLARATFRIRLACPSIARRIVPGQFVMARLVDTNDPLLGRPLALYDTVLDAAGAPVAIDLVYLLVGKMTALLAQLVAGHELDLWGPLGNGFTPRTCDHLVMVAGGIGQTPLPALASEYRQQREYGDPPRAAGSAQRITLCYGARSAAFLAGIEDFERRNVEVQISTDDGSAGHRGFVTELLERVLETSSHATAIACCGPEPMMAAVARIAHQRSVPCDLSLETPMACGLGICFSCVAKVRDASGGWDYRRTCVDGPVFDSRAVLLD